MHRQLEKDFESGAAKRQKRIEELEQQLQRLRDVFEKRQKAKQEIIDLRLKTLINEAEGLKF